ncbi:MAG TPA: SRPBCC domain-containing protein [Cyclobacteriaceae bacterium]|nr:SRPBCC domain-containing protein [Cyclobacteriaceae bacterium]
MKNLLTLALLFATATGFAQTPERYIGGTIDINAPVDSVWSRWTSPAGLRKFFVADARIEFETLGRLDLYMNPSAPEGQRGAENNRILAWQKNKLLSFTWDAPPMFPEVRKQRTVVIVRFNELEGKTNVTITHMGFGSGKEWDEVFNYFEKAWTGFVLPNLKYSCEVPGISLKNMPTNLPMARKL